MLTSKTQHWNQLVTHVHSRGSPEWDHHKPVTVLQHNPLLDMTRGKTKALQSTLTTLHTTYSVIVQGYMHSAIRTPWEESSLKDTHYTNNIIIHNHQTITGIYRKLRVRYYSTSTLSWSVKKKTNNLAIFHAIITGSASIDCAWKCACYTKNLASWTFKKVVKYKTAYIGNGTLLTFFAPLASPAIAYRKFSTQIFNEWSTQRGRTVVQ